MKNTEIDTSFDPVSSNTISEKEKSIRKRILDWVSPAFPLEIREEAVQIYRDYLDSRITEDVDFYINELEFGTGGLRGVLGNGSGRMNIWTVGRVSLAFSRYLKDAYKKPSLVIAHDSRRMSKEFAQTAAGIAANNGLKVYLFNSVAPTPMLSYAVRKLKASGGIVITASHNPPEYNGFKAYLEDGSQLVGEAQDAIEKNITEIRDWGEIKFISEKDPVFTKNVSLIGEEIRKSYKLEIKKTIFASSPSNPAKKKLKIVYSPLHGTGGPWMPDFLSHFGFKTIPVEEQIEPDGEFPTVKYPNPEEAEAMRLSEETARGCDADMFTATDPDADRMGAGVKSENGKYILLNGNQIGSIMCAYLAEKVQNNKSDSKKRYHIVKTIVTTELQTKIAEKNKITIHDVLTGFKYIAEQMSLMENGKKGYNKNKDEFLFGGEESYGYLPVNFVRDKDSMSSTLLLCEILAEKGDLLSYLNQIYLKYGLYLELLKSVTLKGSSGQEKIQHLIENIRKENPVGWVIGERKVSHVLDYEKQTLNGKSSPEDFKNFPKSNVIQLFLEPEGKLTIRPSGTEPKVKIYVSLRHKNDPATLDELYQARSELEDELASIAGLFIARTGLTG